MIQKQLTDRLALALLKGELREGDSVRVDVADGELVLEPAGLWLLVTVSGATPLPTARRWSCY